MGYDRGVQAECRFQGFLQTRVAWRFKDEHGVAWGMMQLELCGGLFGVPGYTRADAVITLTTFLRDFVAGERHVAELQLLVRQAASKLVKWSDANAATSPQSDYSDRLPVGSSFGWFGAVRDEVAPTLFAT